MVWLRARAEWRRRWPTLCALTILIALTGAVVLTALAGARRTRSSIDRAARITHNPDAYVSVNYGRPLSDVSPIAQLPQVAVGRRLAMMGLFTSAGFAVAASPVDAGVGTDLLGYRVLRGRAAVPDRADEIALSETTATALGLDVGDTFDVASPSLAQWGCLGAGPPPAAARCDEFVKVLDRDRIDLSKLRGPHVHLRVVGITRSLFEVGASSHTVFFNVLTPGFYRKYRTTLKWEPIVMVRYRPGITDPGFETAAAKVVRSPISDQNTFTSIIDALRSTAGALANGLLVFAAVAALVGLVLISEVLARNADRGADDRLILRAFGATRGDRVVDACAPLVPVAVVGALLAVLGAWIGSQWMPIGIARRAEFARGLDFDVPVLLGCALVLAAVVLTLSAVTAIWVARSRATRAPRTSSLGLAPLFAFGSVTAATAARMITQVGRGRRAIPLRSAVAGAAVAMAGVIGVAVFAGSLTRLTTDNARQGWGWDALVRGFAATDTQPPTPKQVVARLEADPDVSAVTQVWLDYEPRVHGHTVPGFAQEYLKGERGFVVLRGRAPTRSDEVTLGTKTLRAAHASIGDAVDIDGKSFRVVGTALFPTTANNYALADGALFTQSGLRAAKLVATGGEDTQFAVSFRAGADHAAALKRLRALNNGEVPAGPTEHAEIQQLRQLDRLPWALAGFLSLIAMLAVGHLIVLTVRRRARDLAVLRALGCTPRQVDRIVGWQATMLAIAGTIIGAPIGILVGRLVWARIADAYGVATDSVWPWGAIVITVVGTVVLANLIAWWPARRAGRGPIADSLRAD